MVNLFLENKCCIPDCDEEHDIIYQEHKYCLSHCPDDDLETSTRRLCRYCDIKENSKYTCKNCLKISCKKEWAIIRHLRKEIKENFTYNSSLVLNGCSSKRPDAFFDLPTHVVIGEIDENQHKSYDSICECSRINEIVNSIGGRPVIFVRFNPDKTRNKGIELEISLSDKIDLFVDVLKGEISKQYFDFKVLLFQLYYDDDYEVYQRVKEEDITSIVCV